MQEVALEYYTFTTNDLTPVILKLKAAQPDILHHIARNQDAILFWRQAREQGFEVKAVVHAGATGYGSPDFGKAFGKRTNRVRRTVDEAYEPLIREESDKLVDQDALTKEALALTAEGTVWRRSRKAPCRRRS